MVVRAADPDTDGDGLTDSFELATLYTQRVAAAGLPKGIIDNGVETTVVSILSWKGVMNGAFAEFTISHPTKTELTVQVGYWNGTVWVDRYVWDPGSRAPADTIQQTCSAPTPTAAGATSGYTQSGSVSTVVVDLIKPRSQTTQVERDNRIFPPEFCPALVHSQLSWRIVIRDWVASSGGGGGGGGGCIGCPIPTGGETSTASDGTDGATTTSTTTQGSLTALAVRLEERSDQTKVDTDGDGIGDKPEVATYSTYPTTVDTDGDGARDDFEVVSRPIVYSVNGVARTATVKTSPTNADTDGDGLSDGEEYNPGVDRVVTHPVDSDTDDDLLIDGAELSTHNSNATLTDTDKDTISDFTEVTARTLSLTVNGATQSRTVKTLPYAEDSDGDGLRDDKEFAGTSVYGVKTDPSDADTDDDGLPDGQEKFVKEVSIQSRKTVGTSITVPLTATVTGAIERVDVRYGLSTIQVSNFYVRLSKGLTNVVLRNYQGTGLYNYSSKEITTSFSPHGGMYSLYVSSPVGGGVLEEYALSFTLRTSPVKTDSDGDGLNDSEEATYGKDAWITDPNRADTDSDAWSDGYEVNTKGTNPLAWDTDGDGAGDSTDLDPLRNLLVAVQVRQIHHGNGPWCTPELLGIVRVNNDYAWVTEHVIAHLESFTSLACPPLIPTTQYSTSSFYYTYYADVPDQTSSVSMRMTAWSINPGRGDDILVDQSIGYTLNSGTKYFSRSNGNSWVTFDVWTYALPKAKVLLITDGNATVAASNGQSRLAGQDRYFVFALDATSSYAPFVTGVNAIVVPRSIFLDTKLKKDFDAAYHWPLADATLYGEDLDRADISEAVAAVIAKRLSGSEAYNVLDRLLRNSANVKVSSYVDITSYAVLANLPSDVVKILPWAGVTNGPTGTMPADFWQKIGAPATTVVNSLVYVGQMVYKGLAALGTFLVDLGKAIADWGMRVIGQVVNVVGTVAQKIGETLAAAAKWVLENAAKLLGAIWQTILNGLVSYFNGIMDGWRDFVLELNKWDDADSPNGNQDHSANAVLQKAFGFVLSFLNLKGIAQSVFDTVLLIVRFAEPFLMIVNPITLVIAVAQAIMEAVPALRNILEAVFGKAIDTWYQFVFGPGGLIYSTPAPSVPATALRTDLMPFPSLKAMMNFINLGIVSPIMQTVVLPILQTLKSLFPTPGDFVSWTAYGSAFSLFVYKMGVHYKMGLDQVDEYGAGGLFLGAIALLLSSMAKFSSYDSYSKKTLAGAAMGFSITGFGVFTASLLKGNLRWSSPLSIATIIVFGLGMFSGALVLMS